MTKWPFVLLKWGGTLLSTGLIIYLLRNQDWHVLRNILQSVPWWQWTAVSLIFLAGQALNAKRWHILLKSQSLPVSYWQAFQLMLAGGFASNFLPSTIGGDAVRISGIIALVPDRKMIVASSVVVDRIVNLLNMASLLPIAVFLGVQKGFFTFVQESMMFAWLKKERWLKLYGNWREKAGALWLSFLVSFFSNLAPMSAVWLTAQYLNIRVSFLEVVSVSVLNYFATLLPISINGYGIRELIYTIAFSALGANALQASSLAILTRFLQMLAVLPGGLVFLTLGVGIDDAKK